MKDETVSSKEYINAADRIYEGLCWNRCFK